WWSVRSPSRGRAPGRLHRSAGACLRPAVSDALSWLEYSSQIVSHASFRSGTCLQRNLAQFASELIWASVGNPLGNNITVAGDHLPGLPHKRRDQRMRQPAGPLAIILQSIQRHDPGGVVQVDLAFVADHHQVIAPGYLVQLREHLLRPLGAGWDHAQPQPASLDQQPVFQPLAQLAFRIIKYVELSHK